MQNIQSINFRQVLTFGEVLNVTFSFIRQNLRRMIKELTIIVGPLILLEALVGTFSHFGFNRSGAFLLFMLYASVTSITVLIWLTSTYGYIALYIDRGFGKFTTDDITQIIRQHFLTIIGGSLLTLILTGISTIFLFVPAIYLLVTLSFFQLIIIQEKSGTFSAIFRCFEIISGKWWMTFGILLVLFWVQFAFTFVFLLGVSLLNQLFVLHGSASEIVFSWSGAISYFLQILIYSFGAKILCILSAVAVAVQYFNLVEQKTLTGLFNQINTIKSQSSQDET